VPVVALVSFEVVIGSGCCDDDGTLVPVVALESFAVETGCDEGALVPVVALESLVVNMFAVGPGMRTGCNDGALVAFVPGATVAVDVGDRLGAMVALQFRSASAEQAAGGTSERQHKDEKIQSA
jgi:hypothetical protein